MSLFSSIGKALRSVAKPIVKAAKPLLKTAASFIPGPVGAALKVAGGLASLGGTAVKTAVKHPLLTGGAVYAGSQLVGGSSKSMLEPPALAPLALSGGGGTALAPLAPGAGGGGAMQSPYKGYKVRYDDFGDPYLVKKRRRMNYANPRALRRAGKRVSGFLKMARKMERALPHRTVHTKSRGRR